jgi:DNA-binding PadR family transcriptional regulator
MNLTIKETALVEKLYSLTDEGDDWAWSFEVCDGIKGASGVVASLVKKGLVIVEDSAFTTGTDEAAITLTEDGVTALWTQRVNGRHWV